MSVRLRYTVASSATSIEMWSFDEMFPNVKTSKIMKILREAWVRYKAGSGSTFLYRTLGIDTDKVWHRGSKRIQRSKLGNPHARELEVALEEHKDEMEYVADIG